MKRKIAAFAAMFAVPFLLVACGGSSDSGLSKDELIAKGDQICKDGQDALQQKAVATFKQNPSPKELVKFAKDEVVPLYRDELTKLKALEPDGDAEEGWNAVIEKLDAGIKQFADDPAAAVSSGESPLAEAGQAAQDFGLKVCGSND